MTGSARLHCSRLHPLLVQPLAVLLLITLAASTCAKVIHHHSLAESSGRVLAFTKAGEATRAGVLPSLDAKQQLPYLVHVDSGGTTCSGVFIDPITVITAASCVATRGRKGVWRQALLTVTQGLGVNSSIQHPASWYVVHPGWNKSAELFNVALVRLDRCSTVNQFPRYDGICSVYV